MSPYAASKVQNQSNPYPTTVLPEQRHEAKRKTHDVASAKPSEYRKDIIGGGFVTPRVHSHS